MRGLKLKNSVQFTPRSPPASPKVPRMTTEFEQLKDMFPDLSDEQILDNLKCFGSVAEAAFWLTSEESPEKALLKAIKAKMGDCKVKLKIDEEDLVNDAMTYYKSAEFDPTAELVGLCREVGVEQLLLHSDFSTKANQLLILGEYYVSFLLTDYGLFQNFTS